MGKRWGLPEEQAEVELCVEAAGKRSWQRMGIPKQDNNARNAWYRNGEQVEWTEERLELEQRMQNCLKARNCKGYAWFWNTEYE